MKSVRTAFRSALFMVYLGLVTLCRPAIAEEVTATLSWEPPTTREDGTPLAPAELAGYRIYWMVDDDLNPQGDFITVTGGTQEVWTLDLQPRPEPYTVSFAAVAVDKDGRASQLSEIVMTEFRVKSTAPPLAPTSLQFQFNCSDGCIIKPVQ